MLSTILRQAVDGLRRLNSNRSDRQSELKSITEQVRQHLERGEVLQAEARCKEILTASPNHPEANHLLGRIKGMGGNYSEAIQFLQRAMHSDPGMAEAHTDLGNVFQLQEDLEQATKSYERAINIRPDYLNAWYNLGCTLKRQNHNENAVDCFLKAVELEPGFEPAVKDLIALLDRLGRHEQAQNILIKILDIDSNHVTAHAGLGYILLKRYFDPKQALSHFNEVIRLRSADSELYGNRGIALQDLGLVDEAIQSYDKALELAPINRWVRFHRSLALLLQGRFEEAWPDYEIRLESEDRPNRNFPFPVWDGSDLTNKTILIHGEQGLGDEIMLASCVPDVIASAKHCVIDCSPKLESIFERSFPEATIHGGSQNDDLNWLTDMPPIDCHLPIGSLPLHFRRTLKKFPNHHTGYLKTDERRVAYWQAKLTALGEGRTVGISWRGGTLQSRSPMRSIPLEHWLPILQSKKVHFINLQFGESAAELSKLSEIHGIYIHNWPEAINDYDETAALVSAMDLTISVCTAIIHLAGALGKDVWVMAPKSPEWRYGLTENSMPWYPGVKVYRQLHYGDWSSVISSIKTDLSIFSKERNSDSITRSTRV
ncbi:tetratricopeptide repeat protein [Methylocaldum sp.]|uniref:tetratricopeptide repeat protein n=1 Tax=Methylocaldum sp. TaxID=1969727 RepID=UPI002D36DB8B|nr:tetratricopeptide repeat protein [Methylocaldum sp.]HYE36627.1 tetratricopeptide repeat protein [Methylocaldum sp.]